MRSYILFLGLIFLFSCATKQNQISRGYVRVSESSTKILVGSCNDQKLDQSFWKTLKNENSDMMILMGDNVYKDGEDQQSLRKAYQILARNPWFNEFKNSTPIVATWDDGDFGENDGGEEFAYKQDSKDLFMDFWEEPKGIGPPKAIFFVAGQIWMPAF
jgi:alkaline phosphatase D